MSKHSLKGLSYPSPTNHSPSNQHFPFLFSIEESERPEREREDKKETVAEREREREKDEYLCWCFVCVCVDRGISKIEGDETRNIAEDDGMKNPRRLRRERVTLEQTLFYFFYFYNSLFPFCLLFHAKAIFLFSHAVKEIKNQKLNYLFKF